MAEDHNTQAIEPQSPETVEEKASTPTQELEKMVSVAEMQRRLKSMEDKHSKDTAEAIAKALEKYKAESELTGKELEEYRRKEAEAEKQALLDKIAGLEKEQTKRELTDEAIKTLSSRKLPVNDKVISFVVKDTAEGTLQAISDLESIISEIKAEYSQSEPLEFHQNLTGPKNQTKGIFSEIPGSSNKTLKEKFKI